MSRWLGISIAACAVAAVACAAEGEDIPEEVGLETAAATAAATVAATVANGVAIPDEGVATRFAPDENPIAFDLALIARVTAARAADPRAYADGENPFSIRYAVYNLRNPDVIAGLIDAAASGVDVQVLIESDQLGDDKPWNTVDEELVGAGFEYAPSQRGLDAVTRKTADLVGIEGAGLMHLKTRLFHWVDPATGTAERRLVTGSMNPGDLDVLNDETIHCVAIPALIDRYEAKVDAVLRGARDANRWDASAAANVLFSPDGGEQAADRIARWIDEEQELILLAVFSLRNVRPRAGGPGILDRLIAARRRGVMVAVITDRKQSDGIDVDGNRLYADDGAEDLLRAAGIPVFEVLNRATPFNAMHAKYGIFGLAHHSRVVTDAGNWTQAGLGSGATKPANEESVLFLDSARLDGGRTARRYLGHWLSVARRYQDADDATAIFPLLSALPAWPTVQVVFDALVATSPGESVYVTGDDGRLGRWTAAGPGVPLFTDATRYPRWTSAPVELPFGASLEFKLVKIAAAPSLVPGSVNGPVVGAVTWETGDNRALVLDPTKEATADGDLVVASADWR